MSVKYSKDAQLFIGGLFIALIACVALLTLVVFRSVKPSSVGKKVLYADESKNISRLECTLRPMNTIPDESILKKTYIRTNVCFC